MRSLAKRRPNKGFGHDIDVMAGLMSAYQLSRRLASVAYIFDFGLAIYLSRIIVTLAT